MRRVVIALGLLSSLLSGCAFVQLNDGAGSVALSTPEAVGGCRKLASTSVSVVPRFGIVERSQEAMGAELDILARNEAAQTGGNTVVAASPMLDGRRRYDIYRCN